MIVRAATIDELLSDDFETLPGQKAESDLAARRLAAWCRSCSSGDWQLFSQRIERDRLSFGNVLARFANARHRTSCPLPAWVRDAIWIETALRGDGSLPHVSGMRDDGEHFAFEHLFAPLVARAEALLWTGIDARIAGNLSDAARACIRRALLAQLCDLAAPALHDRFAAKRPGMKPAVSVQPDIGSGTVQYDRFIAEMKAGGIRRLFEDRPVLLRLIATLTRQWIDSWREFILRLDADLLAVRGEILHSGIASRVANIEGGLSDPHNRGRTVQIVTFEDGGRVVYKPKDLRLDAVWYALLERLNRADAPVQLRAARIVARNGYGWTEFIEHSGCADTPGFERFFRSAGAWLAMFHCFAATDMHHENMIASGDQAVPIDLEMILQAAPLSVSTDPAEQALNAATDLIANSVLAVGLLPAFGRLPNNDVYAKGGMASDNGVRKTRGWSRVNSDDMQPSVSTQANRITPNLPHIDGRYAKFGDYLDVFISGFEAYAKFLSSQRQDVSAPGLLDGFAGLPIRKVIRPTRFYYLLLQRLRDFRTMDDGVAWSAQADFIARLGDWDHGSDPIWPMHRAERAALADLNVPYFLSPSDGQEIGDAGGSLVHTDAVCGLNRARDRLAGFDEKEIAWQVEVIIQHTSSLSNSSGPAAATRRPLGPDASEIPAVSLFASEADKIAGEFYDLAIRRGPAAAWIGFDWLGESEVSQLLPLGSNLYDGVSGIGLFLAAHAAVSGSEASADLARATVLGLRNNLKSRNAARIARSIGIGGATGLGSIIYALSVMSKCLGDMEMRDDALKAAELFTDELIASDKRLDLIGGSAGAILGLLRLHRDTGLDNVLRLAAKCGDHLLAQPRSGAQGRRTWSAQGSQPAIINGMSHGAAGFAYALASLSAATGREEFKEAASECIAFENSSYDAERNNWPDLRGDAEPSWRCQWCHGAPGIGLARIATSDRGRLDSNALKSDIRHALKGVQRGWPHSFDTLCCGTLGSIEFFCEAGRVLEEPDLGELASRRLMSVLQTATSAGDYRWNGGKRRFNLGLFCGLAGTGYTMLRRVDSSLPNVLVWE